MPANVVVRDDGRMIDVGDKARVERRFRPEQEPVLDQSGKPVINALTGEPVTKDKLDKDGKPVYVWIAYEKVEVKPNEDGKKAAPDLRRPRGTDARRSGADLPCALLRAVTLSCRPASITSTSMPPLTKA